MSRPKRKYKRKPKCHPHCKRGRHVFTTAERVKGYHNAIEKIIATYPANWVCQHGAHFSHCFLRAKNPLYFEVRKLTHKVENMKRRLKQSDAQNNERLTRIEYELAQLRGKSDATPTKTHRLHSPGPSSKAKAERARPVNPRTGPRNGNK